MDLPASTVLTSEPNPWAEDGGCKAADTIRWITREDFPLNFFPARVDVEAVKSFRRGWGSEATAIEHRGAKVAESIAEVAQELVERRTDSLLSARPARGVAAAAWWMAKMHNTVASQLLDAAASTGTAADDHGADPTILTETQELVQVCDGASRRWLRELRAMLEHGRGCSIELPSLLAVDRWTPGDASRMMALRSAAELLRVDLETMRRDLRLQPRQGSDATDDFDVLSVSTLVAGTAEESKVLGEWLTSLAIAGQVATLPVTDGVTPSSNGHRVARGPGRSRDDDVINPWWCTAIGARSARQCEPDQLAKLVKLWADDPDPVATERLAESLQEFRNNGIVRYASDLDGVSLPSMPEAPWSAVFEANRSIFLGNVLLAPLQRFRIVAGPPLAIRAFGLGGSDMETIHLDPDEDLWDEENKPRFDWCRVGVL